MDGGTGGAAKTEAKARLVPVDVLRGIVMAIMTVDHASETFNAGRFFTDSAMFWKPGTPIPPAQFLTRWITHLCAPTFVFLAGTALAIATERRRARGESARSIDWQIASRGLFILALELVWMSPVMLAPGRFLCQVLYAIGGSLVCMAALRRLSDGALLVFGVVVTLGGEALMAVAGRSLPAALLLTGGFFFDRRLIVAYPLLPWLAIMALGWVLGRRLLAWGADAERIAPRVLAIAGAALLAAFVVVRGIDRYGNIMLHREDPSLLQWLHVSKYPPSVSFTTLELGIALLVLAALFRLRVKGGPLLVIGQVALFYYVLHIHVMHLAAWIFGLEGKLGLASAYVGALATLVALYPLCVLYRRYKATHQNTLTRLL